MKIILIALAAIAVSLNSHAQFALNSKQNKETFSVPSFQYVNNTTYSDAPGQRMKRTGTALTVVGAILFVSGAALVSQADALYYNSTTTNGQTVEEGDPKGGFGVLMMAGGTGMMVPGIIFWAKGAKKYKRYQAEQTAASIGIKGAGLSLRLRF